MKKLFILILILSFFSCAISPREKALNQFEYSDDLFSKKDLQNLLFLNFVKDAHKFVEHDYCRELYHYHFQFHNYNQEKFVDQLEGKNQQLFYHLRNRDEFCYALEDTIFDYRNPHLTLFISKEKDLLYDAQKSKVYYKMNAKNFDKHNFYFLNCDLRNMGYHFPIAFYKNDKEIKDINSGKRWTSFNTFLHQRFDSKYDKGFEIHLKLYPNGNYEIWRKHGFDENEINEIISVLKNTFPEYKNGDYTIIQTNKGAASAFARGIWEK